MSQNETDASEVQVISRGPQQTPILLELKDTNYALTRVNDIRVINPIILPDLLAVFSKSMTELTKALGAISLEIVKTTYVLDRIKAHIILEDMPRILAEKGLKSSEDVRSAIISLDPAYSQLSEQLAMLEAVYENLKSKYKNMELAIYNCKTITQYSSPMKPMHKDYTNSEFGIGKE